MIGLSKVDALPHPLSNSNQTQISPIREKEASLRESIDDGHRNVGYSEFCANINEIWRNDYA